MAEPAASRRRWEELFRGYDIRGRYPEEIDARTARELGRAVGRSLPGPFLMGRDARRESAWFARELERGLGSSGVHVAPLGVVPTPAIGYHARRSKAYGLALTPSHNAVGYVGLKGFTPSGRLFDREWLRIRDAYQGAPFDGRARTRARPSHRRESGSGRVSRRRFLESYLDHLTRGLQSDRTVVLDTRGGATSIAAPEALRRLGARVRELRKGFSPNFFGLSPEPRAATLGPLSGRVTRTRADLGFAFDGDGDRCVVIDDRGRTVDPEVIALLLRDAFAPAGAPLVASLDASRMLERHAPTTRSRVGGRYVTRAMRRTGAEVAMEPSGHYYVRRYGPDSDGILVACLVAHAVAARREPLGEFARRLGPIFRGSSVLDFPNLVARQRGYRSIVKSLGERGRAGLEGVTVDFPDGWCLVRRSNTQPSIRFAFEATGPE
ncbi:MAG: hypothetical protein ACREDE_06990, partial [Thermoplasmata archaeon]